MNSYKKGKFIFYMIIAFNFIYILFFKKQFNGDSLKVGIEDKSPKIEGITQIADDCCSQPKCKCNLDTETCILSNIDHDRERSNIRAVNRILTEYRSDLADRFQKTIDRKLSSSHPDVLNLARDMMDAPSKHLYKASRGFHSTPQSEYLLEYIYPQQKNGFFVECGALDGERSSNTHWLEKKMAWTGLLIEVDPYYYTQLLGKNRNAWSINACLSPSNVTQWVQFKESVGGVGKITNDTSEKTRKVPCFPFQSLLLALNRTDVDFVSLDVEGLEMEILHTIPHRELNIKSWTIEYHKIGEYRLQSYMAKMGYKLEKKIDYEDSHINMFTRDLIFSKF